MFACGVFVLFLVRFSVRFDDSVNRERVLDHSSSPPARHNLDRKKSSSDTDLARLDFLARRGFDQNGFLRTSFY